MPRLYKILSFNEKVIFCGILGFAVISFGHLILGVGELEEWLISGVISIFAIFGFIRIVEWKYRHRRKERRSSWKSNDSLQFDPTFQKRMTRKLQKRMTRKLQREEKEEQEAQYKHTLKKLQKQRKKKEVEQKDEIKQLKSDLSELKKKVSSMTPKEIEVKDIKKNTFRNFPSRQDLNDNFPGIDPFQMEELTGVLFEKKGYTVEVTKRTGDFGIDVWVTNENEKIGIQVKKQNDVVGFDHVSKTLGSNLSTANRYIIISTISFFSKPAIKWQKEIPHMIELWDTNRFKEELEKNDVMT